MISCSALVTAFSMNAQHPVQIGSGSVASEPPTYKARTTPGGPGFNATAMLTRNLYLDEGLSTADGQFSVPSRPIPTNDWWTDIINSRFSGALWSYPAMLHTSEAGVEINSPSYWADFGKEMKSKSNIKVGGKDFRATATIASDWHDWDVRFRMPSAKGTGEMQVTAVHGSPFTWIEFTDMEPRLTLSGEASIFASGKGYAGIKIGDDLYGLYCADDARCSLSDKTVTFDGVQWLSVALLRSAADLEAFAPYASSIPRATRVDWSYDEVSGKVSSRWTVNAENLRDATAAAPVLQGFLPHAYKYALPGASLNFTDSEGFVTPRGKMLLASSPSGSFAYDYSFSGMLPYYAAPTTDASARNPFRQEVLDRLMGDYSSKGTFGGDTYWGGKGLVQMALNMTFARQTGNDAVYQESKRRLREALVNWLTYSPGEDTFFFSYYPRWGAMLGFDVSYDSDAFNDHHFHYGYFTYAAALLCLEDEAFASDYGEVLTLIAKDYANWDRNDSRFPILRTLDPWCGHSWAGGLGDTGNDNGNGQESSSEAMQGWAGIYLLGVALDNREMRDAGIWGWNTEARATREYWFDVDAPRPANDGGRKPWPGKGDRQGNYDYTQYPYAYNSNITGKGIGWWTWFGGDPLFMHGIQWMPVSPALDYLSWDADFTAWAIDDMMRGANSTFSHSWFEQTTNSDNGESIEPLASNDWGNVALSYLQRSDPAEAARIFDEALDRNMHIATSVSTSHISYFVIHNHLTYGDPDFEIRADIPTAQVCRKGDRTTFIVYNPDRSDRTVTFYDKNGAKVRSVKAPARRLAAICDPAHAASLDITSSEGFVIAPGSSTHLSGRVLDQYGAGFDGAELTFKLSDGAQATLSNGELTVGADAALGSIFTVEVSYEGLAETLTFTVNYPPRATAASIDGLAEICELGIPQKASLLVIDQYGDETRPDDTRWSATPLEGVGVGADGALTFSTPGHYTVTASSARLGGEASADIVVAPKMPELSKDVDVMASSAENVGTMPEGACDQAPGTRWGSSHSDGEWIVLDLGEDCHISRVGILWEAAYASRYMIQTAPSGCEMTDKTVKYAGTDHNITVPADDAWTTVATEQASGAGARETVIGATGRYVRMLALERATTYGVSLYEMDVYGVPAAMSGDAVIGIDFTLPEVMDSGSTIGLEATAYTRSGNGMPADRVEWSSDKEARFSGNDFTPLSHGLYTLKARTDYGTGSATVFVNEMERPAAVKLSADHYVTPVGDHLSIPFEVWNQFLAPYGGDADALSVKVYDSEGNIAAMASYDIDTMEFEASGYGEYTVDFGGLASCKVEVVRYEDFNLALGKDAWDSSHEADWLSAKYAVDGSLTTRWGSTFADGEWMVVDLGKQYIIDNVRLYWNNPAYATHYSVELSDTGAEDDFTPASSRSGFKNEGAPEEHDMEGRKARYVKVTGHKRATGYGTSLDEFEVYGRPIAVSVDTPTADNVPTRWYTLDGQCIARPTAPGIYIRRSGAKAEKIVITNR